jgi:hypothetical protein
MWSQELLIDRILKGKSWQEGLLKINLSPNPAVCALPPFKVFSAKEVSERWGLSEGNALFRLTVSTGTLEPVVLNNHAILEVVFHDGYQWRLFPFGKYPEHFPEKITTAIPFFLLGSPGVIIYPDIKELVPGRISKSVEVHVPSKVAHTLLEKIGQEIIDTQQKSLHTRFHPRYQNCAQWAEGLVKEAFEAHHIPIDPELNMELYQAVHCFRISNDLVEKGTFLKQQCSPLNTPYGSFR